MGRPRGSIDLQKRAAVLEATISVLDEFGPTATLEMIAQRSGVSRQTLYSHYRAKHRLIAVVIEAHQVDLQPAFIWPDPTVQPRVTLARYATQLLTQMSQPRYRRAFRALARGLLDDPEQARRLQAATLGEALRRLAHFLAAETAHGRLAVANPPAAAELFLDLVIARPQLMILKGVAEPLSAEEIEQTARRCAQLFVGGYSVALSPYKPATPSRKPRADSPLAPWEAGPGPSPGITHETGGVATEHERERNDA